MADDKEEDAKRNVAERPAVLQGARNEEDLHYDVDKQLNGVQQVQDDKQADRVGGRKTSPALKSADGDEECDGKCDQRAGTQQPYRQRGAVLVQLEADEAIDKQAGDESAGEAALEGNKVWIWTRAGRHDAGVDNEGEEGE